MKSLVFMPWILLFVFLQKEIFSFSCTKSCTHYATWPSFQGLDCICINNNSLMFIKSLILHESTQLYKKAFFSLEKFKCVIKKGNSCMIVDLVD